MELSLDTDGTLAVVVIRGEMAIEDVPRIASYLALARANGAVRCVLDLAACPRIPTAMIAALSRETEALQAAGGLLALVGLASQNPFLDPAEARRSYVVYESVDQARAALVGRSGPGPAAV